MNPLYTEEQYNNSKSTDKLPCKCKQCNNTFYIPKKTITYEIKHNKGRRKFCSRKCFDKQCSSTSQLINCTNCGKTVKKILSQIKKSKNLFCTASCAAIHRNKNKKHGIRRSKIEKYLEQQLNLLYTNIDILYNDKKVINSELDIYIPSLNLAFELNGIFHYKPIFGDNKLTQIQNNDKSKIILCFEKQIDLCIIDISGQKQVKASTSQKYLDIIISIIDDRLKKN